MQFIAAATDKGKGKEKNQDSYLVELIHTADGLVTFAVLCDGMGGYKEGALASSSLVNIFHEWAMNYFEEQKDVMIEIDEIKEQWGEIICTHNKRLIEYGTKHGIKAGTTVVVIIILNGMYLAMNVGDSRVYQIDTVISQVTKDHSFVQREIERGNITKEEARTHPKRNILLQCVGVGNTTIPDFFQDRIAKETIVLLCTDGYYHELSEQELLRRFAPLQCRERDKLESVLKRTIQFVRKRGERDDASAIGIYVPKSGT